MSCSPVYNLDDSDVMLASVQYGGFGCHAHQCIVWRSGMSFSPVYSLEDLDVTLASVQSGGFGCHTRQLLDDLDVMLTRV